jgi:hypothetical protein
VPLDGKNGTAHFNVQAGDVYGFRLGSLDGDHQQRQLHGVRPRR